VELYLYGERETRAPSDARGAVLIREKGNKSSI